MLAPLLLSFCLSARAEAPATLLPPEQRLALPDFSPIPGLEGTAALRREALSGTVAVVNIWYEF